MHLKDRTGQQPQSLTSGQRIMMKGHITVKVDFSCVKK